MCLCVNHAPMDPMKDTAPQTVAAPQDIAPQSVEALEFTPGRRTLSRLMLPYLTLQPAPAVLLLYCRCCEIMAPNR